MANWESQEETATRCRAAKQVGRAPTRRDGSCGVISKAYESPQPHCFHGNPERCCNCEEYRDALMNAMWKANRECVQKR